MAATRARASVLAVLARVFFATGLRAAAFFATAPAPAPFLAVVPVFFAATGFALARIGAIPLRLAVALATLFLTVFFAAFFDAAVFIAIPPMAAPLIRADALFFSSNLSLYPA